MLKTYCYVTLTTFFGDLIDFISLAEFSLFHLLYLIPVQVVTLRYREFPRLFSDNLLENAYCIEGTQ